MPAKKPPKNNIDALKENPKNLAPIKPNTPIKANKIIAPTNPIFHKL